MNGYDENLIKIIIDNINYPVTVLGGASFRRILRRYQIILAHWNFAGSIFVFQGIHKAVLINYPSKNKKLFLILFKDRFNMKQIVQYLSSGEIALIEAPIPKLKKDKF